MRSWLFAPALSFALSLDGCLVDGSLTCGPGCAKDGGHGDATATTEGGDASAGGDASTDGDCPDQISCPADWRLCCAAIIETCQPADGGCCRLEGTGCDPAGKGVPCCNPTTCSAGGKCI